MSEEERQRVIRLKLARLQSRTGAVIPTGFAALDEALGVGGMPRGRIVELFGPSSGGKTTLALQIVSHAQQSGLAAAWIDADHAFDPAYAAQLAVNLEGLPLAQPEAAEEALEVARQLVLSGAVDLLVVDSAAALVPRMELETALGESGPGMQSRVLASGLRKLSAALARTGAAILFLNQTRGGSGDSETSAGGPGLKLYSAVRISLEPAGRGVRFRTVKNKVAAPFAEGELRWGTSLGFVKHA
ncbi:Protein RecA [Candidatus Sulfopaludibacter sp. SbA3]|nr:Protein RecA [Candidatus Sulfopaludibacter sp. SbA3]